MKPIIFTKHALDSIADRKLDPAWVEATVRTPDRIMPDPNDPQIERRFRCIPQAEGRVLRVPVVETATQIRVITLLFDRNARRRL